jgi:hypothetical protein
VHTQPPEHVTVAWLTEYFPASHAVHAELPDGEPDPGGQDRHREALEEENVPVSHSEHAEPPPEYFPASHAVHAVIAVLPVREPDPGGHDRHTEALEEENVPSAHSTHLFPPNTILHAATKPEDVYEPSEVNTTCRYPVDEVYTVLVDTEETPLSRATCSTPVLHDGDVHRLMVTKSNPPCVEKDVNVSSITPLEENSQLQLALFA